MIRSLSLMLAMLAITMGAVFWLKWQPADLPPHDSGSVDTQSLPAASSSTDIPPRSTSASKPDGGPIAVASGDSSSLSTSGHAVSRLVDLNSATVHELASLPGIGTVLAQRVIAHRISVGRFQAIEDLREVKGIGSKKFDQIKSLVTVARGELKDKTEKRPT